MPMRIYNFIFVATKTRDQATLYAKNDAVRCSKPTFLHTDMGGLNGLSCFS